MIVSIAPWLAMLGFGAFHGLNPGMGWLFALSLGLQQQRERVIWLSLLPIAAGHALAIALAALLVLFGTKVISVPTLQWLTAGVLLAFGLYKLFNYYRHPRWVGMKVGMGDLFLWSFLMATAHGAGLMVVPALIEVAGGDAGHAGHGEHASHLGASGLNMLLAISLHTGAMLLVMGATAWIVYRKFGLAILRRHWINFDLIWAIALLIAAAVAVLMAL
ncbi:MULTISPECIES: hypothetical protein [Microbulbifer]|uniref:hypothetical protein n=1 Tax=Microbulbifer TaxID=48073 RepID=UPI001CD7E172|nr:hypothetical protein [Microbulbifer agarilyticus]MCA0899787.1 hypothetical protein [Microbulbifer agarilyticus]